MFAQTEFRPVQLETSCIVNLPPIVSVLCINFQHQKSLLSVTKLSETFYVVQSLVFTLGGILFDKK